MSQRRILFLHLGHSFGGIEVYMANLAALLGKDAIIVALCSHPHLLERLEAHGVQVIRFPQLRGPLRGLRFLLALLLLPFILIRHKLDTVHINGHWEAMLLLPCRLLGRRTISTRHQTWDIPLARWWHAPKRTLSSLLYNTNARFAHKIICVSGAVATEVRQHLPGSKVEVIPNWIAGQPPFQRRPAIDGKTRILFVGRMVVFKGLQVLIEALQGLPNVTLTAVGEGELLEQFREQAQGLDVTFTGFYQDVRHFYREADIFVMPSIGLEGLPLVSLEAMGNGLPCIFSDLAVHREITANGAAAALFRTGDAKDLRAKLQYLMDNEEERRRLSQAAYATVQQSFTAAVARQRYHQAFALTQTIPMHPELSYEDRPGLPQRSAAAK